MKFLQIHEFRGPNFFHSKTRKKFNKMFNLCKKREKHTLKRIKKVKIWGKTNAEKTHGKRTNEDEQMRANGKKFLLFLGAKEKGKKKKNRKRRKKKRKTHGNEGSVFFTGNYTNYQTTPLTIFFVLPLDFCRWISAPYEGVLREHFFVSELHERERQLKTVFSAFPSGVFTD